MGVGCGGRWRVRGLVGIGDRDRDRDRDRDQDVIGM